MLVGLRKVTDDMKTHKNPSLREMPPAKPAPAAKPSVAAKPQPPKPAAHPPKCVLESKKWIVVSAAFCRQHFMLTCATSIWLPQNLLFCHFSHKAQTTLHRLVNSTDSTCHHALHV